ncbi:MAG: hypothetical protein ACF8QF_06790 [Phycisphaerales bacterium]
MGQSMIDPAVERMTTGGFAYPLGVYPVEAHTPREGYAVAFEPADGGEEPGDWEEWPDRYVYDIVISATRLRAFLRSLFALLPARIYPILDILGSDAYREIDPYIAYDLVGFDRFLEGVRRHGAWLYEDGMVGFGAMCDEPFVYVYVDEHKVVTVRVETALRERVERVLEAFDLSAGVEEGGVDAVAHEHRGVLLCPPERPDLLTGEEVIEELADLWRLRLNVDRERNLDDDGRDLGTTGWRCLVRRQRAEGSPIDYAEAVIAAGSLDEAETLALDAALSEADGPGPDDQWPRAQLVQADRVTPEQLAQLLGEAADLDASRVLAIRWLVR